MSELKPCPFCGCNSMPVNNPVTGARSVLCSWCQAEGGLRPTETEAIKAWNERTSDPVKVQILVALKHQLEKYKSAYPYSWTHLNDTQEMIKAIEAAEKELCK